MDKQKKWGIITPVANEEEIITQFVKELSKEAEKIPGKVSIFFVIDKVSTDKTLSLLKKASQKNKLIHVVYEPKNRNLVDAYVRGYKEALKQKCDYIIEIDCGFSHQPKEIHKFVEGLQEGYDCVFGTRPLWSPFYKAPFMRRIYSLGGTVLANVLLGTRLKDMTSGFEAFTAKSLKSIIATPLKSTGHFFQTEIRFRARKLRSKQVWINYNFTGTSLNKSSLENSFTTLFSLMKER